MADFRFKRVIVTGAASGIGRACAQLFFESGAQVAATDVNAEALEAVVREIPRAAGSGEVGAIAGFCLDSGDAADIKRAKAEISKYFGGPGQRVHVLVNNAGVGGFGRVGPSQGDDDDAAFEATWDLALRVNLLAQARMVRAFFGELTDSASTGAAASDATGEEAAGRGGGSRAASVVVNIASTEGLGSTLFNSAYSASKHASIGLTRALAVEMGAQGCRVVAICPGPTRTGMTDAIPERQKVEFAKRLVPLRRYAAPEEVAAVVVAVAQPGLSFLNGAVVPVDGGISAHMALLPRRDWWEGASRPAAKL